jgi:hypothetical protein
MDGGCNRKQSERFTKVGLDQLSGVVEIGCLDTLGFRVLDEDQNAR